MCETDYFKAETLESAKALLEETREYILTDYSNEIREREPGFNLEVEDYDFPVNRGEFTSLKRVFFLDYASGKIDWELEILKAK